MKKSLLALAALTAFAGVASAQSTVTLFGIVDVNARDVKNGSAGSLKTLSTSGNATSRLGFRGVEDLGGGLRAGFWIEGELNPDVGGGPKPAANGTAAGSMDWTRRSTVSLIGNFGEIRLGRDYTPTFLNVNAYDPWGYVGVATLANLRATVSALGTVSAAGVLTGSGATTAVRASNQIEYILPAMGGLYGQINVAAGENAQGNKYVGGRLGYGAGPINVSGAYGKTYKTGTMVDDLTNGSIGASYNFGFLTVQGLYEESKYSTSKSKLGAGSVLIPVGLGTIKLSYNEVRGSSVLFRAKQVGAGYVYDLSKRTAVYAQAAQIKNDSTGAIGTRFTSSSGGNAFTVSGQKSTGYEFGVRHSF